MCTIQFLKIKKTLKEICLQLSLKKYVMFSDSKQKPGVWHYDFTFDPGTAVINVTI